MILQGGTYLLEYADLVNEACLSVPAYKKALHDERIKVVQSGGGGHPALIDWASLPARYKELVRANMGGDPEELVRFKALEQHMPLLDEDARHIDTFRADNGRMLPDAKRRELKKAVRVMALLASIDEVRATGGTDAVVKTFGMAVLPLKEAILRYIKLERVDLPGSFARLEARKRDYLHARKLGMAGAAGLIHAGYGNKNSAKVTDPLQAGVLETIAGRHQNLNRAQIASQYNTIAKAYQWPAITPNTVKNMLSGGAASRSVTFYAKGAAAYQEKHGIVIHRSRPTQPTLMWVHDSTVYELYYQGQRNGKPTHWLRKWVCVVLDPHTWYPVGYAIGDTETIELTQLAVKNAVDHMRELTGGYVLPYQAQSDRGGHKALEEWYQPMGVVYTPAKARNARSKVIEPYFNAHHRDHVQPYYLNYGGHNIDAKKANQPNPDALERLKKQFPNEATVIEQIHEAFARERAAKREQFTAGIAGMPAGMLRTIDRCQYLDHFGTRHEWLNELTNRGLCPTIQGEEIPYQLYTRDFQERVGQRFQVVYDPADLSNVLATSEFGAFRYLVEAAPTIPMALQDSTPETRATLARIEGFKRELGQEAIVRRETAAERARLVVSTLLEAAAPVAIAEPKERRTIGPNEEAHTRSYVVEKGSHKKALATAQMSDREYLAEQERLAEEDL